MIIVGLIAGGLARKVMKASSFGLLSDIIIGVIGALVGSWLAKSVLGLGIGITGFHLTTILMAFTGALLVLFLLRRKAATGKNLLL